MNARRKLLCLVFGALAMSCAGVRGRGADRKAHPAPAWFKAPQQTDNRFLYFVGSANAAPDESTARELAAQKALSELSVYCGATLTTDFSSIEVEKNGELNQEVALTVDVAGEEVSIQEAATEKWVVGKGSDGTYDAYVRIKWPVAQFRNVQAAQRAKAERALALLLRAEEAAEAYRMADAERYLKETKQTLGPVRAQIPLDHPNYKNSGLVFDAARSLSERLRDLAEQRRGIMAVSVVCAENQAPKTCASRWVGTIRQRVNRAGFELSSQTVDADNTRAILDARDPTSDAALRTSGFVLAVKYDARLSSTEDGFVFARCGARGVVFDTDQKEIVHVTEVKPQKGGHVHFAGAVKKGCAKAEAKLTAWIDDTVGALKGKQDK